MEMKFTFSPPRMTSSLRRCPCSLWSPLRRISLGTPTSVGRNTLEVSQNNRGTLRPSELVEQLSRLRATSPSGRAEESWSHALSLVDWKSSAMEEEGDCDQYTGLLRQVTVADHLLFTLLGWRDTPKVVLQNVYEMRREAQLQYLKKKSEEGEKGYRQEEFLRCRPLNRHGIHYYYATYFLQLSFSQETLTAQIESVEVSLRTLLLDAPQDRSTYSLAPASLLLAMRALSRWRKITAMESVGGWLTRWLQEQEKYPLSDQSARTFLPRNYTYIASALIQHLSANPTANVGRVCMGICYCLAVTDSSGVQWERLTTHNTSAPETEQGENAVDNLILQLSKPLTFQHVIKVGEYCADLLLQISKGFAHMPVVCEVGEPRRTQVRRRMVSALHTCVFLEPKGNRKAVDRTSPIAGQHISSPLFCILVRLIVKSLAACRDIPASSSSYLWHQHSEHVCEALRHFFIVSQNDHCSSLVSREVVDKSEERCWDIILQGVQDGVFYTGKRSTPGASTITRTRTDLVMVLDKLVLPFYTRRHWRKATINRFVSILKDWGGGPPHLLRDVFFTTYKREEKYQRIIQKFAKTRREGNEEQLAVYEPALKLSSCATIVEHCCTALDDWATSVHVLKYMLCQLLVTREGEDEVWGLWIRETGVPLVESAARRSNDDLPTDWLLN